MVRSRRPELEKDNPIAPQPYIGPRRRRALAREASSRRTATPVRVLGEIEATLRTLLEAAERFVNGTPRSKKLEAERNALLEGITQARRLLSVEPIPANGRSGRRRIGNPMKAD
ncbi:MAG: hypothetical protein OJF47_001409 [Nitrospira sp.]|jgi:hypothetical protein|nr:MAG: hypothetical protein OJF47_001409 [Nitrospira sp.]